MINNHSRGEMGLLCCESGKHFALKVLGELKKINPQARLIQTKETRFANSELKIEIGESVRNLDVFIFQDCENKSGGYSVNDNFMVLKTLIEAARRSDANYITAVIPSFPYARQDKPKTREAVTAAMVARELEDCGATMVLTLDIHTEAIVGFFRRAILENLRASKELLSYIKNKIGLKDLVICAPDAGGTPRASFYAKQLDVPLAVIYKERDYSQANTVENMTLLGDVKTKTVVVVDDMIDTAGTLVNSAKKLKEEGAANVYFAASLALLNGPAVQRLNDAHKKGVITKIIGTDAINHGQGFSHEWYDEVSLASYFASVIHNVNQRVSISKLLN